jgi:pimeloyl-ACP methyl ester carboxylesterase
VRNLLRMGTVWKMKDRAGTVGGLGVSALVTGILADTGARLHLIGHSFGARVVLSALAMRPVSRPARSVLLLQPAVNRWCFAPEVPGLAHGGGYHPVLDRVELPILSTMSTHDFPLHEVFHLALRGSNLGEPKVAAIGDFERYGALGGYGPAGLGAATRRVPVVAPGTTYDLSGDVRVIALDGSGDLGGKPAIGGHGDVISPCTWWALHVLAGSSS